MQFAKMNRIAEPVKYLVFIYVLMKCQAVVVVLLISTVSLGIVGYSSSIQPASALTRSGSPTIVDLRPWLFRLDPCILNPDSCIPRIPPPNYPVFGPPPCICPVLDVSKVKLNESVILTPAGQSVIVTKVPLDNILGPNINAQLNRTTITGNMSSPQ
jgi:hypothetical protein